VAGLGASSLCSAAVLRKHALVRAGLWRDGCTHRAGAPFVSLFISGGARHPLRSAMTLFYMSIYLLFWMAPFVLRTRREFRALVITVAVAIFLRWHRISPFSCRSGVCAATRGRSRHLGGAVSFCRQTESHLQPPALTARGVVPLFAVAIFSARVPVAGKVPSGFGAMVAASTVLIHQHHLWT